MRGVGVFSVGSVDRNGAVIGVGSGDGVAIQNEVGRMPSNSDIAGVSTDFIKGIYNGIVHFAALPNKVR